MRRTAVAVLTALASAWALAPAPAVADLSPSDPAYTVRDTQNIADAYGRITGPGGQLRNPAYLPALVSQIGATSAAQLLTQVADPTRPALTAGNVFPGWNVGNPLRAGWERTRGRVTPVAFTNRYGALLRGHVYRPAPGARDPYTGRVLRGPFPGVVVTTGSVQGSEGMYEWLAQDLAERGYVVLTYDVQGQGTSETLPHTTGDAFPFCNPFGTPADGEMTGCPGVPAQQLSNFVVGTRDALSFFTSTPERPYRNPGAAGTKVSAFNPTWRLWDRSPDPHPATPGRTTRIAIVGHSLGATAVSQVQAVDRRVAAVVALDKLASAGTRPVVPALAVQSEYGFTVSPWYLSGGSSLMPQPSPAGPDPRRERATGFDAWRRSGVDSMLVVPRASTHLEYTDIPLALPASRHGQALASVYVQRWLDRYVKHEGGADRLTARSFRYLEPVGDGRWAPVTLRRDPLLSYSYCSAYAVRDDAGRRVVDGDVTGVGCR
ncbi:alpha/beta hydrolase [Nocardioides rubriscoriae]|uniref:alpha/beta hydrolase n=1 Tax=Nocardioides rubriscoriae TaxID=642762 RepID=UPI001FEBF99F|nr:alpha/beta hydrolase [Nocardioides rubriscoriae]